MATVCEAPLDSLRLVDHATEDTRARLGDNHVSRSRAHAAQLSGAGALRNLSTQNDQVMITRRALQNARTRLESKSYKHTRATRNLAAKYDMQKRAVEASTLFFWTCFFYPQSKRDCEESSGAKH